MNAANADRVLVRLLREAALPLGVRVEALGEGWILRLTWPASGGSSSRTPRVRHVHGYAFDLNPAATHMIACDKAATAEVLASAGVACVPHRLVLHPSMSKFVPMREGSWRAMLEAFEAWGQDVVVKENDGTGGRGVSRCRSVIELERAAYGLFMRHESLAVCPYVPIASETRLVMLDGACVLAYEKVRATVVGDGVRSVLRLMGESGADSGTGTGGLSQAATASLLENLAEDERGLLTRVPALGQRVPLNWRHNLGQGATARLVDASEGAMGEHVGLARAAAAAMNLRFGSVDVVRDESGKLRILEVNSGVMMEFLARALPEGEALARRVYGAALRAMGE
jgi:glutathione synthase/RimK-type ligase-like ATP-grasp enzyme